MITWWMKLGNLPSGHDALLFSIGGTGSCICQVMHTDTAGHTETFHCPVMDHMGPLNVWHSFKTVDQIILQISVD